MIDWLCEASVLVAVLPLVDEWVARRELSLQVVVISLSLSAISFVIGMELEGRR